MKIDYFMGEAIKEAKKALKNNEVPIGGVLIDNYSALIDTNSDCSLDIVDIIDIVSIILDN